MLIEIEKKKKTLHELRILYPYQAKQLDDWYNIELTYTSNAIEGNTLTRAETALVIEHDTTVSGKSLNDHNEAKDHYNAMTFMRQAIIENRPINEQYICDLHYKITASTLQDEAGFYSKHRRRVTGSNYIFPNPQKVPSLMQEFSKKLELQEMNPTNAFNAHLELVIIHPFSDGNGRTARLLMNSILLKGGYCPINILPEQKPIYIKALQAYTEHQDKTFYDNFMLQQLLETLNDSIKMLTPEI
jgi:Fic family protein